MGTATGSSAPTKMLQVVWCKSGRATARVAPTDGNKECDAEEESPSHLGKGAEEDGRKQRLFDTIKPPPGGGGFRGGICGEGDLRGGGYSA